VPDKETALGVPLARLLATPDMWRTFAGSYLDAPAAREIRAERAATQARIAHAYRDGRLPSD
jgi:hypothetical protein